MQIKLNLNKKYLLACSAGVDSMVLLDLMKNASFDFEVAHFNHLTRGDDNLIDYQTVKEYCDNYQIKLHYKEFDFTNLDGNFHALAHQKRFEFFKEIIGTREVELVTAHHLNDLLESQMLSFIRGGNVATYQGFSARSFYEGIYINRPLIVFSKTEIYDYAAKFQINYHEDYSNQSLDYTRNKLRNKYLNEMLIDFPHLLKKSKEYQEKLNLVDDFIKDSVKNYDFLQIDILEFNSLHLVQKQEIIATFLKKHDINTNILIIKSIIAIALDEFGNKRLNLNNNYVLYREYNHFVLAKETTKSLDELIISDYGSYQFLKKTIIISKNLINNCIPNYELCYNSNAFSLKIRTRRDDDYLIMPYGKKKLNRFLIDNKVGLSKRDNLIIIESDGQILYIDNLFKLKQEGKNKIYIYIESGEKNA